jgi:hypothetical protein
MASNYLQFEEVLNLSDLLISKGCAVEDVGLWLFGYGFPEVAFRGDLTFDILTAVCC